MPSILVGYDGLSGSRDALALTRVLAPLMGADVIAASVLTYAPTEATWALYERMLKDDEERLAAEAREGLQGVGSVETVAVCGSSPPRDLSLLAERREADLMVLGSTHRGTIGRVLPGTVADRLMSGAPCPLAIAPHDFDAVDAKLQTIGVAYDGSAEAESALGLAAELAPAAGASLELVAVADPDEPLAAAPGTEEWPVLVATEEGRQKARAQLREAVESVAAELPPALDVRTRLSEGDPRFALVEASRDLDLLVIGSRGYGPLKRVLLGAVSSAVVRRAACPVIVMPRSVTEAPQEVAEK